MNDHRSKRAAGGALIVAVMALLCLIWGTTWAVIKVGLRDTPPFTGVALRFGFAGLVVWGLALVQGVRLGRTARERWLWVTNGLLSFAISYGVVYWSEQHIPSGLAAVLFATYPLMTAVLSHLLLPQERVGPREAAYILLSFLGVALIYSEDFGAMGSPQARQAAFLMILSPLSSAFGSVLVKKYGGDLHPYAVTAVPMGLTGLVAGAAAFALERNAEFDWNPSSIGALAYLTLAGTVVTFTLYFWLLRQIPVRRASLIAYIVPIVAVVIGVAWGEPLTPRILGGAALVVLGVAMTSLVRR